MMYDLIIIGGGPAGYIAAERASHAGIKTLLIEKAQLGGVCLNEGCIPTKTLLYSAKLKDGIEHGERYGVAAKELVFTHSDVLKRKAKVVNLLVGGVRMTLKAAGAEVLEECAVIKGQSENGFEIAAGAQAFSAKKILIATGSVPVIPPIQGLKEALDSGFALTSKQILDIDVIPQKLLVVGGGVIGMEMASYFNSAGANVTVIEMMDNIGGSIDTDIAAILKKNYEKKGIRFLLGAKVTGIQDGTVSYEQSNELMVIEADKVLLCIGRRPFSEGLGLESVGVKTDRFAVWTDDEMQTDVKGIFAAGDVTGKSMLAHSAYREAEVAVNNMLGRKDAMQYSVIPYVIYTSPEVAGVGETEMTATEKGLDIQVKSLSMSYSGRYVAENDRGDGIIKIVVDKRSSKLIGIHLIGSYASEIIFGAAVLMEKELDEIKKIVFPHPTAGEIIREAIFQL